MSRWDAGLGVNTDDPDELEVGCLVFSKTCTRSPGDMPRGGTIIGLCLLADDDATVMSVTTLEQGAGGRCDTFTITRDDIDMETAEFYGRNADVAAKIISQWLAGSHAPRDKQSKLRWQRIVLNLAENAAFGQWLPKAEYRWRRNREADAAS